MKKPQKPHGYWGFVTCIYFGHIMWLRGWDFSLPFRKHSHAASAQQARLGALLVFVTRFKKGHTVSFFLRLPTPCAAALRLPEVVVKNPVLRAAKEQTTHVGGLFFCCVILTE